MQQAVKLWSSGTLYVVNQASPVTLSPDAPAWMQTDASGNLSLAISAFDDGTPAGMPNVACPPLLAWANFMSAGEAIVIYPDHESLGTLANVQGSSSTPSTSQGGQLRWPSRAARAVAADRRRSTWTRPRPMTAAR